MRAIRDELAQLRKANLETEEGARHAAPTAPAPEFKAPASLPAKAPKAAEQDVASCRALEVIDFRLVEGPEDVEKPGFAPTFAHQHFGDDEEIRGYRGLRVSHYYAAGSLQLFTRIAYAEKQPGAVDVGAALRQYMPDEDVEQEAQWGAPSLDNLLDRVAAERRNGWQPPGRQIGGFEAGGRRFQVRRGNIAEPGMRAYHQRMRPFVIWFVDAANFIDDHDDRWDVFMLFREPATPGGSFCLCGYATSYTFFSWAGAKQQQQQLERFVSAQGPQVASLAVEGIVAAFVSRSYEQMAQQTAAAAPWYERRFRVSQFLILPPFQRAGHGARLFEAMCDYARGAYAPLRDITVEDPSPSFVAMRDYCDLSFLLGRQLLQPGRLANDHEAIARALRVERHVCAPQVKRVLHLVKWMEAATPEAKTAMRREIKRRLYKENSADIEDDQESVRSALSELWAQEESSFNATLLRLKLIN